MKQLVAATLAGAVAFSPLAGQAPAYAMKAVIPTAGTVKGLNIAIKPVSLSATTAAPENYRNLGPFSLISLPGLETGFARTSPMGASHIAARGAPEIQGQLKMSRKSPTPVAGKARSPRTHGPVGNSRGAAGITSGVAAPAKGVSGMLQSIRKAVGSLIPDTVSRVDYLAAKTRGARLFDGRRAAQTPAADYIGGQDPDFSGWTNRSRWMRLLKAPVTKFLALKSALSQRAPPRPKTPYDRDDYGGPQTLDLRAKDRTGLLANARRRAGSLKNHAFYGFKWAINMMGIATLVGIVVKPISAYFPWQVFASPSLLELTGRIELMTEIGHQ